MYGHRLELPSREEIKINIYAVFDGSNFRSSSGMVAHNFLGKILASKSTLHSHVGSIFAVEALTCSKAVKMETTLKIYRVIIKSDTLTMIKKCKMTCKGRFMIDLYIRDVKSLLPRFRSIHFHHVNRLVNNLANLVAKECLRRSEEIYLFVVAQIDEYIRELNYR